MSALSAAAPAALGAAFEQSRGHLWALCYRMTGSAADADDLVQDTFQRALERPPADTSRPWLPWLVRVAINLSRDALRKRRRRGYVGTWLPEPVDVDDLVLDDPLREPADTEGRYEQVESVSYAFLVALEALTPQQRAVLILRDVLEYDSREAAEALDISLANARTTLHRARRAMAAYDARRCPPGAEVDARTREVLLQFLSFMASGDAVGLQGLLAGDACAINDSGGRFAAARKVVHGASKVARFHVGIARAIPPRLLFCRLNGLPAVSMAYEQPPRPRLAPRIALLPIPDRDGRLRSVHLVLAPAKLARVPLPPLDADVSFAPAFAPESGDQPIG